MTPRTALVWIVIFSTVLVVACAGVAGYYSARQCPELVRIQDSYIYPETIQSIDYIEQADSLIARVRIETDSVYPVYKTFKDPAAIAQVCDLSRRCLK